MKHLQFSTTINCSSCVRAVSPTLNELLGAGNWSVDTQDPNKILTVLQEHINVETLVDSIIRLGYSCVPIQKLA